MSQILVAVITKTHRNQNEREKANYERVRQTDRQKERERERDRQTDRETVSY